MFSCFLRSRKNKDKAPVGDGDATEDNRYVDPPRFTQRLLTAATGNFAAKNKLGERERGGDLGPAFKGKLEDGQVVAVRRLSARYWQSFQFHELKDELVLAAKLKHDNIVQLLGVCLEQREKLLVYEYLPNASLDTILFDTDQRRRRHLDWEKRYSIIRGIARGLLYLHEESGLGISHKGILRPSKVLLDDDMNPKIMDAGIPPPNTDVAFPYNLTRYGTSGRKDRYIAASLGRRYPRNEMRNCVHIGLLCLQKDQTLRPDALAVMQALDISCPTSLPTPSIPHGLIYT